MKENLNDFSGTTNQEARFPFHNSAQPCDMELGNNI